jgi:hypothetical protein
MLVLAPTTLKAQVQQLVLTPVSRIGSLDGAETAFGRINVIAPAPDGRIAVGQPASLDVWIFSPEGERLDVVGRQGEGPGEFRMISMTGWRGDTLWVADGSLNRVTLFPPGGRAPVVIGGPARRGPVGTRVPIPATGGHWFTIRQTRPPQQPDAQSKQELLVLDTDWSEKVRLATFNEGPGMFKVPLGGNQEIRLGAHPFADHPLAVMSPRGMDVTIVRRELPPRNGAPRVYTLTRVRFPADTVFHRQIGAPAVRITKETRDAVVQDYASVESIQRRFGSASTTRAALADGFPFPAFHPPVSDMTVGLDGRTWVRGPDDQIGPVRWQVFDNTGRLVANVTGDRRISMAAPDATGMWGVVRDDLDVHYLVRYSLAPAPRR